MTSWWLGNLLEYSLQVMLLITAGGLLAAVFRLREPRLRLAYLQTLLACCLLLPLVQPWRESVATPASDYTLSAPMAAVGNGQDDSWGSVAAFVLGGGAVIPPTVVGRRDHPSPASEKVGATMRRSREACSGAHRSECVSSASCYLAGGWTRHVRLVSTGHSSAGIVCRGSSRHAISRTHP